MRFPKHSNAAYPRPDDDARWAIEGYRHPPSTEAQASVRILAFFVEVFSVAAELITEFSPRTVFDDERQLAVAWRLHLEENGRAVRKELYRRAEEVCLPC